MEKAGNLLPRGKGTLQRVVASHGTCALLGALLAAACYLNSLQGALVHDDIFAIRDNADVKNTPLFQLLRNDFWGKPMSDPTSHKSYRPITVLSFRLDYYLHGLEPYGYHVTNLLLHVIVTCLFGVVCRVVVFGWWCDVAFLSTLLFAAHPVHTEAVSVLPWQWGCGLVDCVTVCVATAGVWNRRSCRCAGSAVLPPVSPGVPPDHRLVVWEPACLPSAALHLEWHLAADQCDVCSGGYVVQRARSYCSRSVFRLRGPSGLEREAPGWEMVSTSPVILLPPFGQLEVCLFCTQ